MAASHSSRLQCLGRSGTQLGGIRMVHTGAPELFDGGSILRRRLFAGDRARGQAPIASSAAVDGSRLEAVIEYDPDAWCGRQELPIGAPADARAADERLSRSAAKFRRGGRE